jgi:hypothetical protein
MAEVDLIVAERMAQARCKIGPLAHAIGVIPDKGSKRGGVLTRPHRAECRQWGGIVGEACCTELTVWDWASVYALERIIL